jgi:prepilin-type N-terminal cleavage/methylation domain-containing protein/prepilin-type processing-associated H-X9-DG protein
MSTPCFLPGHPRARRSAFTLVELLTVIAIVGLLAAILIPVVIRVRDSARSAQCASNLRQIGVALKLYVTEHKNTLPPTYTWSATSELAKGDWSKQLLSYLPRRDTSHVNEVFVCPSADYNGVSGKDLSITYGAAGAFMGIAPAGSYVTETEARKLNTIDNLPRAPWIFDMHANGNNTYPYNSAQWPAVQSDVTNSNSVRLGFRHAGDDKLNMLFGDGHVQGLTREDILAAFTFKKWDAR